MAVAKLGAPIRKLVSAAVIGPGLCDVCGEGIACAVVASVPEPTNWAMMIAGFGLLGAVVRRRRYLAV